MARFVIVHGAFGGGWEWTPVARIIEGQGHDVWTPTLSGLGDRIREAKPTTNLETHVQDLLGLIDDQDLDDVVLCAASYGGMPATVAADRAAERIASLVYVDALVPHDGESALDLLPRSFAKKVRDQLASRSADAWKVAVPSGILPPQEGVSRNAWTAYVARLCPQPAATFAEPATLSGAIDGVRRGFVRCTRSTLKDDPIEAMAVRARHAGWEYRELSAPHDPHLFDPEGTARAIVSMAEVLRKRDK